MLALDLLKGPKSLPSKRKVPFALVSDQPAQAHVSLFEMKIFYMFMEHTLNLSRIEISNPESYHLSNPELATVKRGIFFSSHFLSSQNSFTLAALQEAC